MLPPIRDEIMIFIRACETLHTLLTDRVLTDDDRTLIQDRGEELLSTMARVTPGPSTHQESHHPISTRAQLDD